MADGRYALIVASSRYSDARLTQLDAPDHDARSLSAVLATPEIGDFEVTTLTDEPAPKVMQEIEAFFGGRRREDLVLLYFSGHGILDESARLYFATEDTRVDRPRSTAVPAAFVNELMGECLSRRQVLMLDCCNSGAFARGLKAGGSVGTGERFEGRGRVVITASDALQYAFEGGRVEGEGIGSVFTSALVDGLQSGDADLNGDGRVTLDELYDYVYGRVLDSSPRQRPHKWAFGVEGQIFIARSMGAPTPSDVPAQSAEVKGQPVVAPSPAQPRTPLHRRPLAWAAAALLGIGAVAAAAALVLAGGDGGGSGSPPPAGGRDAALSVFDSWQAGRLDQVDDRLISASARRALTAMPIEPITPTPPAPDGCYGDAGDITCSFDYPGLHMSLLFNVLRYSTGLRLADVRCYNNQTGDPVPGGMAACARIIKRS
jgi:Caspase domain